MLTSNDTIQKDIQAARAADVSISAIIIIATVNTDNLLLGSPQEANRMISTL